MKDSYLSYAMSVIMSRALPDVRDGLKPSQRRILVAMNDLARLDLASKRGPEHDGVKGQQQLVVFGQLVSIDESDGDKPGRLPTALWRHALDCIKGRFQNALVRR